MHVSQVTSESPRRCSVFKSLLLSCGLREEPTPPNIIENFHWLPRSSEKVEALPELHTCLEVQNGEKAKFKNHTVGEYC